MFDETRLAAPDMRHGVWALSGIGLSQIEVATEGLAVVFVPTYSSLEDAYQRLLNAHP